MRSPVFDFGNGGAGDTSLALANDGATDTLAFAVYDKGQLSGKAVAPAFWERGQWVHLVVTVEGAEMSVFKDGQRVLTHRSTRATAEPPLVQRLKHMVGQAADPASGTGNFEGALAYLRFWHGVALLDDEVASLYGSRHADARETWGPSLAPTTTFYPSTTYQAVGEGGDASEGVGESEGDAQIKRGRSLLTTPKGGFMPTMLDGSEPTAVPCAPRPRKRTNRERARATPTCGPSIHRPTLSHIQHLPATAAATATSPYRLKVLTPSPAHAPPTSDMPAHGMPSNDARSWVDAAAAAAAAEAAAGGIGVAGTGAGTATGGAASAGGASARVPESTSTDNSASSSSSSSGSTDSEPTKQAKQTMKPDAISQREHGQG